MRTLLGHIERGLAAAGLACCISACTDPAPEAEAEDAGRVGADAAMADATASLDARPDDAAPSMDTRAADAAPSMDVGRLDAALDAAPQPPSAPAFEAQRFNETVWPATHNSYSGGARGSLPAQLEAGVRFIELDVHADDYGARGFRVGHDAPGDEVEYGAGNPVVDGLEEWLEVVARWSQLNPRHLPLTLGLDLKDDLSAAATTADGNLGALNALLVRAFGARLLPVAPAGEAWPTLGALRGRVIVVLSGSEAARRAYRADVGESPAVAIDARGRVVEVHASGNGTLWYWAGQREADGSVTWHRHGRYDTGLDPAVALDDQGTVVEVHRSENNERLWYRVGQLEDDFEISWGDSREYDDGISPTIAFDDLEAGVLTEVHQSGNSAQRWTWRAQLNRAERRLTFSGNARTDAPFFEKASARRGRSDVRVFTAAEGNDGAQTLRYSTDAGGTGRIRYAPRMHVEVQPTSSPAVRDAESRFFAAVASSAAWVEARRLEGGVVRQWGFNAADAATTPASNFPATDTPSAAWYLRYLESAGAVVEGRPARASR